MSAVQCVIRRKWVRHAGRGAARRKLCGVCAAAGGSYRRQSPGPEACCTPRPPPRSPRPPRRSPPGRTAWSSAPRRSSSATWCVGSETTPTHSRSHLVYTHFIESPDNDYALRSWWIGEMVRYNCDLMMMRCTDQDKMFFSTSRSIILIWTHHLKKRYRWTSVALFKTRLISNNNEGDAQMWRN